MKTIISLPLIISLLMLSGVFVSAQKPHILQDIGIISESEKSAYGKLNRPREQLIVNNYDLKYHRFYWFTDPAEPFIRGAVTSYFVATQPLSYSVFVTAWGP